MNIEEKTPYSNVITPPDFSEDQFQSVLLIDASWNDIEDVIHWSRPKATTITIFIFIKTPCGKPNGWIELLISRIAY